MNRSATKTVQLVANPAAGRHCARKVASLAGAFERAGVTVVRSECGPGMDVAVDPRCDHLCVVGGDGTVRHAVHAVARSGRALGVSVYPGGTINLIHREASCALDPDLYAAAILAAGAGRDLYAASLGDSLFVACASVGPDSHAVARLSPRLKRRIGRAAYAIAFLRLLFAWPRHAITLRADGRDLPCEAFYVAKGRYFAGPWSFAPDARIGDARLHVVALQKATRFRYLRFLLALIAGRPVDRLPGVTAFTCTSLAADCAEPLPVQADGDIAATLPIEIAVRPEPIRLH